MRSWIRSPLTNGDIYIFALASASLALACAAGTSGSGAGAPEGCDPETSELGRATFAQCAVCHAIDPAIGHGTGPNLAGVIGRPIGKSDGFRFSPALREASGRWSAAELDRFLANPQLSYPGVRMAYAGIPDAKRRKELICYLANLR